MGTATATSVHFGSLWKLICEALGRGIAVDEVVNAMEPAMVPRTFLMLQKAAWDTTGKTSPMDMQAARDVLQAERAAYAIKWAKRFGTKIKMLDKLQTKSSSDIDEAYSILSGLLSRGG